MGIVEALVVFGFLLVIIALIVFIVLFAIKAIRAMDSVIERNNKEQRSSDGE